MAIDGYLKKQPDNSLEALGRAVYQAFLGAGRQPFWYCDLRDRRREQSQGKDREAGEADGKLQGTSSSQKKKSKTSGELARIIYSGADARISLTG